MVTPLRIATGKTNWNCNRRSVLSIIVGGFTLFFICHEGNVLQSISFVHKDIDFTSNLRKVKSADRTASKHNFIYTSHTDEKLEPTSCSELLRQFRSGQIKQTNQASKSYPIDKSYITRSNTEYSFQVSVHDKVIDGMRYGIFNSGEYYENIMSYVIADILSQANKEKSAVMLDIGANIGWFSLLAASYGAEVFSFEPNVINMIRFCESQMLNGWSLADNVEVNNRIHSYMKGVGSRHGDNLNMYTPDPNNPGAHTFNQEMAKDHFSKRNTEGALQTLDGGKLPIITLDALAKDQRWLSKTNEVQIVLMKMDIEGLEYLALNGAKELLRSNIIQNVLMEFNADSPREDWVSLLSTLFDSGYELYKIGGHQGPNEIYQLTSDNPEVIIDDIKKRNGFGVAGGNVNAWFKIKK